MSDATAPQAPPLAGEPSFSRQEVERAIRGFRDRLSDVQQAVPTTWPQRLGDLVRFCERDPVMRAVTRGLREAPGSAEAWVGGMLATRRSMVGSATFSLPDDLEAQLALEYKLLVAIQAGTVDLDTFMIDVFGATRDDDVVRTFNAEVLKRFAREVGYRLDELAADVRGADRVPAERLFLIFNQHGTVVMNDQRDQRSGPHASTTTTNISGVTSSNVAVGGSTITGTTITTTSGADLGQALRALRDASAGLEPGARAKVGQAVDTLVAAAEHPEGVDRMAVAQAASEVAAASPGLAERLKQIAVGAGGNVAGAAVIAAIKYALGV